MKRRIQRRLSASFLALCIVLSQSCILPAFGQYTASAKTELSGAKNAKKAALSVARKKMGTDIVKLLDSNYLSEGESKEETVARFKENKQYVAKNDSSRHNLRRKGESHDDLVYVYIQMNKGYATSSIDQAVWEVTGRDEGNRLAVAYVEVTELDSLASLPSVASIKLVTRPKVRKGSVTAEGDIVHKTAAVRSTYAQEGAGVKIGVISDGVDNMASAKSKGDLPSSLTVLSNTQGGDEGTAMLEIIYDMAPGASLYFHDNGEDMVDFNAAVDELVAAGCKVIVDDLGWDEEAFFENGVIGSHVASVMASNDVVFVSAAGNEADVHYQGQYYDNGGIHDFSRGSSSNKFLYVTLPSGEDLDVVLQWDDRFGQSSNDYDLALYNKTTGAKLSESTDTQNGSSDPLEAIYYTNDTSSTQNIQVEVIRYDAPQAKTLELFLYPSDGEVSSTNIVAADSVYGHPAIPGVMAVAAIDAKDSGYDTIEYYSSRGPVTIIGEGARQKPDITALDNVAVTGVGDFGSPFAGTSASAPAVGAIVAQLWGAFPSKAGAEIRDAIYASAVDLGASGFDTTYGYGRADAMQAYLRLKSQSAPATPTIKTAIDDGDGYIKDAETSSGVNLSITTTGIEDGQQVSCDITSGAGEDYAYGPKIGYVYSNSATVATGALSALNDGTLTAICSTSNASGTAAQETSDTSTKTTTATTLSSAKSITSFSLAGKAGTINETNHTVSVTLPAGTSVTSLAPTIGISAKATINPASGTYRNFTSPVTYTVTAENGSTQIYTVTVTVSASSSAKAITSFSLLGKAGTINETDHTITVNLPAGTSTYLVPSISVSSGASVNPAPGAYKNFSSPVTYTVTAQDGSTQTYTVTVDLASAADTTPPVITLNGNASITLKVGDTYVEQGASASDAHDGNVSVSISGDVDTAIADIYHVTYSAEDASGNSTSVIRTVTVTDEEEIAAGKTITSFIFEGLDPDVTGVIDESTHKINLTVPYGTNISALVPTIVVSSGASVSPKSGVAQNFTYAKTYTVTASDGTKQTYTAAVAKAAAPQLPSGIFDGDIIQCKNSSNPFAVYIVKIVGNKIYIRHIVTINIFNFYRHLRWSNLKQVDSLSPFKMSGWVRVNTGVNGRPGPSDRVWEINGDQSKHWIHMTGSQFLSHGGSDEAIFSVNQGELDLYSTGSDVTAS